MKITVHFPPLLSCLVFTGDVKDASANCGRQHVQEFLYYRGDVLVVAVLRFCRCRALRHRQIRREH